MILFNRTIRTTIIRINVPLASSHLIQFHIVHFVHELFHFIFLLTVLSVVFAFCSLYPRKQKVCRVIEKFFRTGCVRAFSDMGRLFFVAEKRGIIASHHEVVNIS
jgi:hypothetical protein